VKFVVDQQLPATLACWFEERGFEAVHVRDLGMRDAPDRAIWRYAVESARDRGHEGRRLRHSALPE